MCNVSAQVSTLVGIWPLCQGLGSTVAPWLPFIRRESCGATLDMLSRVYIRRYYVSSLQLSSGALWSPLNDKWVYRAVALMADNAQVVRIEMVKVRQISNK